MKVKLLILGILVFTNVLSYIKTIDGFEKLSSHVQSDPSEVLVLLDLDLTVLKVGIKNSHDFEIDLNKLKEGILSTTSIVIARQHVDEFVDKHADFSEGEPGITGNVIKDLQDRGYCVVGLTSRELGDSVSCCKQLQDINVRLNGFEVGHTEITPFIGYNKGVIFCACCEKTKVLELILQKLGRKLQNLVFVDDIRSNLEEFQKSYNNSFLGLHYTKLIDEYLRKKEVNDEEILNVVKLWSGVGLYLDKFIFPNLQLDLSSYITNGNPFVSK